MKGAVHSGPHEVVSASSSQVDMPKPTPSKAKKLSSTYAKGFSPV